ncbi:MAG: hypothetical protein IKP73_07330 [Bacteroidales bacterium]|nr:hypothetical protein [Bacteroidales bacterium]
MAGNFRFYKRTTLRRAFEYVRNFLAVFGLMVILYHSRPTFADALNAIWLYLFEFPLGLIADAGRTILNYTIYGT